MTSNRRIARHSPVRRGRSGDRATAPVRWSGLLGAPVGLGRDERACVQILARPVTGRRVAQARRAARRIHHGSSTRLAAGESDFDPVAHTVELRQTIAWLVGANGHIDTATSATSSWAAPTGTPGDGG